MGWRDGRCRCLCRSLPGVRGSLCSGGRLSRSPHVWSCINQSPRPRLQEAVALGPLSTFLICTGTQQLYLLSTCED